MAGKPPAARDGAHRSEGTMSTGTTIAAASGFAGRGGAERKYDLITAIGSWGMAQGGADAVLALRFVTLLTARYNWRRDELVTGQREIAALWSVDPRTVKRQMARLRELGWLDLIQQGARGRVARYRLNPGAVLVRTQACFANVGPDFVERLMAEPVPPPDNVVRFPEGGADSAEGSRRGTDARWGRIAERLAAANPHMWTSWLAPLDVWVEDAGQGACLVLVAPTRFHARHVETHLVKLVRDVGLLEGIRAVRVEMR